MYSRKEAVSLTWYSAMALVSYIPPLWNISERSAMNEGREGGRGA